LTVPWLPISGMHGPDPEPDVPDPDRLDYDDLRTELSRLLGSHGATALPDARRDPLPRRWLVSALHRARQRRGLIGPVASGSLSDRELLEATLHWVGADVERVLAADDPRTEVEAVYRGLVRLERRAAAAQRAESETAREGAA